LRNDVMLDTSGSAIKRWGGARVFMETSSKKLAKKVKTLFDHLGQTTISRIRATNPLMQKPCYYFAIRAQKMIPRKFFFVLGHTW
jgi:hypothetical protein